MENSPITNIANNKKDYDYFVLSKRFLFTIFRLYTGEKHDSAWIIYKDVIPDLSPEHILDVFEVERQGQCWSRCIRLFILQSSFFTISNSDRSKSGLPLCVFVGVNYLMKYTHSSKVQSS